ncbi:hypothetical protein KA531_02435 [Candidatus Saccharibacteria bacterium]|nr:hypothetical protein [Candidatus Saccharibacteria bacterium]
MIIKTDDNIARLVGLVKVLIVATSLVLIGHSFWPTLIVFVLIDLFGNFLVLRWTSSVRKLTKYLYYLVPLMLFSLLFYFNIGWFLLPSFPKLLPVIAGYFVTQSVVLPKYIRDESSANWFNAMILMAINFLILVSTKPQFGLSQELAVILALLVLFITNLFGQLYLRGSLSWSSMVNLVIWVELVAIGQVWRVFYQLPLGIAVSQIAILAGLLMIIKRNLYSRGITDWQTILPALTFILIIAVTRISNSV